MNEMAEALSVLGLSPHVTVQEIQAAYLRLVKQSHPDKFMHDETLRKTAELTLKKINWAYEYLQGYRVNPSEDIGDWHPKSRGESVSSTEGDVDPFADRQDEPLDDHFGDLLDEESPARTREITRTSTSTWSSVAVWFVVLAVPTVVIAVESAKSKGFNYAAQKQIAYAFWMHELRTAALTVGVAILAIVGVIFVVYVALAITEGLAAGFAEARSDVNHES